MDKSARFGKAKGAVYCDKPGTSCHYGPGDVCVNCGRKKGWRRFRQAIIPTLRQQLESLGVNTNDPNLVIRKVSR